MSDKAPGILKVIEHFFENCDLNKIADLYNDDGGWEKWLQSELGYHIYRRFKNGTATREQEIWEDNKDRVDMVYTYARGEDKKNCTDIIELKCASIRQDEKLGDFVSRFNEDIDKLCTGIGKLKTWVIAGQDCVYYVVVGITMSPEVYWKTKEMVEKHKAAKMIQEKTISGVTVWSFYVM